MQQPMIRRLDHVAIRVADRVAAAAELIHHFELHVIERTERFTLIGADFEHGKITLLDPDEDVRTSNAGRLGHLVLFDPSVEAAAAPDTLACGIAVRRVGRDQLGDDDASRGLPRHALIGFELVATDPVDDATALARVSRSDVDGAHVQVGAAMRDGWIQAVDAAPDVQVEPAVLDHVGLLVDDVDAWRDDAASRNLDVTKFVEAANSRALFVAARDGVVLEFIEHAPSTALA